MREVKQYNYRMLDSKAKEISFLYKKMKLKQQNKSNVFFILNEGSSNDKEDPEEYIKFIDKALKALEKDDRDFIYNEYFNPEGYNFWWLSYYSRSSYYRRKKKALVSFLNLVTL